MSKPLERTTLLDALVIQLEQAIATGEYAPDTKLPTEGQLAAEYEVSRPIVREALAHLRERGYIETVNGRGTFVRQPNIETVSRSLLRHLQSQSRVEYSVDDLYEARRTVELESTGLAAARATASDLTLLEKHIETMKDTANVDLSAYTAADVSFHLQIAEATKNPLLSLLVTPLVDIIVHGMFESVQSEHEGMLSGVAEHTRILEKLREGDAVGAQAEMAAHLTRSREVHPRTMISTQHSQATQEN